MCKTRSDAAVPFRLRWTSNGCATQLDTGSAPVSIGPEYADVPMAQRSPPVVREFAKRRAHIGLIARGEGRLQARREEEQSGGKALLLPADHTEIETAAERFEDEFAPIDVWVNDAIV